MTMILDRKRRRWRGAAQRTRGADDGRGEDLILTTMNFTLKKDGFYTENDGFYTENDGFRTKNAGEVHRARALARRRVVAAG